MKLLFAALMVTLGLVCVGQAGPIIYSTNEGYIGQLDEFDSGPNKAYTIFSVHKGYVGQLNGTTIWSTHYGYVGQLNGQEIWSSAQGYIGYLDQNGNWHLYNSWFLND